MKIYLGDAVYAKCDDETPDATVILTTENGEHITNEIYLEPFVIKAFLDYLLSKKHNAMMNIIKDF